MLVRDGRISEIEEENKDLCKDNNDLLPDDEDPMEDMDVDPESDQEDDELRDNAPEESDPVVSRRTQTSHRTTATDLLLQTPLSWTSRFSELSFCVRITLSLACLCDSVILLWCGSIDETR